MYQFDMRISLARKLGTVHQHRMALMPRSTATITGRQQQQQQQQHKQQHRAKMKFSFN
jgi:hypothetical protein